MGFFKVLELFKQAGRIRVAYAINGYWGKAQDLKVVFIDRVSNPSWGRGLVFAYKAPNADDDECYLNIYWRPDLQKYEFACGRMSWAPLAIYLDNVLVGTLPEITAAFVVQPGFINFVG